VRVDYDQCVNCPCRTPRRTQDTVTRLGRGEGAAVETSLSVLVGDERASQTRPFRHEGRAGSGSPASHDHERRPQERRQLHSRVSVMRETTSEEQAAYSRGSSRVHAHTDTTADGLKTSRRDRFRNEGSHSVGRSRPRRFSSVMSEEHTVGAATAPGTRPRRGGSQVASVMREAAASVQTGRDGSPL
jgi:hypothetical protein